MGLIGTSEKYNKLPEDPKSVRRGYEYKVAEAGIYTNNNYVCKPGDLLIVTGTSDTSGISWDYFPSADERETLISYSKIRNRRFRNGRFGINCFRNNK